MSLSFDSTAPRLAQDEDIVGLKQLPSPNAPADDARNWA